MNETILSVIVVALTDCSFVYDHLQKMGQFARGEGKIAFLLTFIVLGHLVRRLLVCALKLTYQPMEMYGNGH